MTLEEVQSDLQSLRALVSDVQSENRALRDLVNRMTARVAHQEDPRGRMFLANTANPGFTNNAFVEIVPTASGSALATLTNGRTVSGSTDPGVFLAIPSLKSGEAAYFGFANGTNAVYIRISEQLRFGKIQSVGDCNQYCVVKPCKEDGTLLSDHTLSVVPTLGSCDSSASGYCYAVGGVIAYAQSPDNPNQGIQVGAHHKLSMGYQCGEAEGGPTNLAHVDDLNRIEPYLGDFKIGASSDCGGGFTNLAQLNWRGFMVVGGYSGGAGMGAAVWCGATNTAGTGGVKVLSFDATTTNTASLESYAGSNSAFILFSVDCATTSANVPTIGGSPCIDNSLPKMANIKAWFPVDTFIKSIDSATGVCNTNTGHIDITLSVTTARACVPFP